MNGGILRDKIELQGQVIEVDRPLAPVGFLYGTLNGNDFGRVVFNRKDFKDSGQLEFHFNQTIFEIYNETDKHMKKAKLTVRQAIVKHFSAVDKTGDLREEEE